MHIEEVNELLGLDLPVTDEYQTLGGFLLYQFQKIPTVGEVLHHEGLELTVISAEGPRLHHIQIHRLTVDAPSNSADIDEPDGVILPEQISPEDSDPRLFSP
jgi:CBS domain containing-hemolysin-like protein